MPLFGILLDDVPEVKKYKVSDNGVNGVWLLPQPNKKLLLVVVRPIFYVLEWSWANWFYRLMVKKGLKKAGYDVKQRSYICINRIELVERLLR